jgi:hypothetical protein
MLGILNCKSISQNHQFFCDIFCKRRDVLWLWSFVMKIRLRADRARGNCLAPDKEGKSINQLKLSLRPLRSIRYDLSAVAGEDYDDALSRFSVPLLPKPQHLLENRVFPKPPPVDGLSVTKRESDFVPLGTKLRMRQTAIPRAA